MKRDRGAIATLIQAITGFNNLSYHSWNKDNGNDPACRLCGQEREEFLHLVNDCVKTRELSSELFGPNGLTNRWDLNSLETFLENPTIKFLMENRKEDEENLIVF